MRDAFGWVLGLATVIVLCGALQWFAPQRSVEPLATRFLCDGPAVSVRAAETAETDVLSRVSCVTGGQRSDVTNMAFLILTIPCALAVAAASVLGRRVLIPRPRTRIQRAHT